MTPRPSYPAGVPSWIDLVHPEALAVADFYGGLFGWTFEERLPPGDDHYLIARLDGLVVAAIGTPDDPFAPVEGWTTYVAVDDAAASAARVRAAGGEVLAGPTTLPAGTWVVCADPTGARFALWQADKRLGAELVNAPGSWNFSNASTQDVERAIAFYGEVFGWTTERLDLGDVPSTFLLLPGYGDFLESITPGTRASQAEGGAPAFFADVVAYVVEGPPRWDVTFGVDGTDAAVARAEELGAKVVVPIADEGPTRVATLEDPWGHRFTLSTYTPETPG